jgi:hypothetical protein
MLDLAEFSSEFKARFGGRLGQMFDKIQDAINQQGTMTGVDPTQHTAPTSPPNDFQVVAGSDHVHVTITDHTPRPRAQNYFVEWSVNDPSFLAPHMEHLGASRGRVLALAAMGTDMTVHQYYFRAYSHTLGAKSASQKLNFGGTVPTAVTLTGASTLDYLPSTGGGTAATNGQQGGKGFGDVQLFQGGKATPKQI